MKQNNNINICLIALVANSIVPYTGFVVFLLYIFISLLKGNKEILYRPLKDKWFAISILYLTLLTFVSEAKTMHVLGLFIFVECILIHYILNSTSSSSELLKYFAIGNIIVAIGGILQFYLTSEIPSGWIDSTYYASIKMRAYGVMINPNVLAGYLALCLAVNIQFLEAYKDNWLNIVAIAVSTFAMILTYSRSGWISLICISLIIGVLRKKKRYFIYIGVFILLICIINGDYGIERINISNTLNDNSIRYRLEIYKAAVNVIKDHFFMGTGFFGTSRVLHNYSDIIVAPVNQPHNLILYFVIEIGVLGFSLVVFFIYNDIRRLARLGLKNIVDDKELVAYLLGFTTICIHGIVDAVSLAPQFLFYIIYILSLFKNRLNTLDGRDSSDTKLEAFSWKKDLIN